MLILIILSLGIITALIAKKRQLGHVVLWFVFGCLLAILAIPMAMLMSPKSKKDLKSSPAKKCPFCAEFIKAEALKCRFCQSEVPLEASPVPSIPSPVKSNKTSHLERQERLQQWANDINARAPEIRKRQIQFIRKYWIIMVLLTGVVAWYHVSIQPPGSPSMLYQIMNGQK